MAGRGMAVVVVASNGRRSGGVGAGAGVGVGAGFGDDEGHLAQVCTVCVLCVYCVTVRTVEGVRTRTTKEEKRHAVWLLAARFCVIRFCSPNVGHLWFCSLVVGVTMATFLVGSSGGTRRSFVSSDLVTSY